MTIMAHAQAMLNDAALNLERQAVAIENSICHYVVAGQQIRLRTFTLPDNKKLHEKSQAAWFTNHVLGLWLLYTYLSDDKGNEMPGTKWKPEEMSLARAAIIHAETKNKSD